MKLADLPENLKYLHLPTQGHPFHLHLLHAVHIILIRLSGCRKCGGSNPALPLGDVGGHLLQSGPITPLEVVEHGLQLLADLPRKHSTSLDFLENLQYKSPFAARVGKDLEFFQKRMGLFPPPRS